jgi:hypothetical protein
MTKIPLLEMYSWVLGKITEMEARMEVCEEERRNPHKDLLRNHARATATQRLIERIMDNEAAVAEIWDGIAAAEEAGIPLDAIAAALRDDWETAVTMLAVIGRRP